MLRVVNTGVHDDAVADVCDDKDTWTEKKQRLNMEIAKVDKLLRAITLHDGPEDFALIGNTDDGEKGRTRTWYPQIGEWNYVQSMAKRTRMELFSYTSVDLNSAHLHVAFSACVLKHGEEEAGRLVPCLRACVKDRNSSRQRVADECGITVNAAKSKILASLNQEGGRGGTLFIDKLREERSVWLNALSEHPAAATIQIDDSANDTRRGALLLQCVEDRVVRRISESFAAAGWETGGLVADGLMVRPAGQQAIPIDAALRQAEKHVLDSLTVTIKIGIEYAPA